MESLPEIVTEALASGAAAGIRTTAKQVVTDSYQKLRELIAHRYATVDVSPVEHRPDSQPRRAMLAEALEDAGATRDTELLVAAQELIAVVRAHEASAGAAVGVDLERIQAAALRIEMVDSTGTGVRVVDGKFDGAIEIGEARTGRRDPADPPQARR